MVSALFLGLIGRRWAGKVSQTQEPRCALPHSPASPRPMCASSEGQAWQPVANCVKSDFRLVWGVTIPGYGLLCFRESTPSTWQSPATLFSRVVIPIYTPTCSVWVPPFTHPWQHLVFADFIFSNLMGVKWCLIFGFNLHVFTIEHLFICSLVIWVSSSVNSLFISFALKKKMVTLLRV